VSSQRGAAPRHAEVRVRLDPADVEAIAERVLDLLDARADRLPVRYVDAATLAEALGVDRTWVYAHARELRAIRLGGARGRLRFDIRIVERVLLAETSAAAPAAKGRARRLIRRNGELLPINP
jgi:hypothetical protein